jgi:hypothetical protein
MEAVKKVPRTESGLSPSPTGLSSLLPGLLTTSTSTSALQGTGSSLSGVAGNPGILGSLATLASAQYDEVKREGETVFEAKWSATLTAKGKLTRPQLGQIEYKSTKWKE